MKIEVILKAEIEMVNVNGQSYPWVVIKENIDNGIFITGSCINHSVESLTRLYQRDFEYRNPNKGNYEYYVIWKGTTTKSKLFQKQITGDYGEAPTYIDETYKN